MSFRAPLACALLVLPVAALAEIQIRVVEGDGAINSIRLRRAHDLVVQVVDSSGRPVSDATVSFVLPATGPSATFADKSLSQTLQTDANGMAASRGLRPNQTPGEFRIRVTASSRGEAASAEFSETNAEPVKSSSTGKRVAIIALIGGAAAGGVLAATHGGGSSGSAAAGATTPSTPGTTIVAGPPTLGPPH